MTGYVLQDASAMLEVCYAIGINLVNGKEPIDGTSYKSDDARLAVHIPYKLIW